MYLTFPQFAAASILALPYLAGRGWRHPQEELRVGGETFEVVPTASGRGLVASRPLAKHYLHSLALHSLRRRRRRVLETAAGVPNRAAATSVVVKVRPEGADGNLLEFTAKVREKLHPKLPICQLVLTHGL